MTGMEEKYGGRERVWHPRTVSYSFSNSPKWPDWHVIRVNPEIFWNWVTNFWCVCWCQRGLCFHLKRFPPKHKTWPKKKVKSLQFSCSGVSDSLWPHGLQHSRPHCPSPIPKVYLNSCPLSWWCHPTISSSVVPFSSCLQSFPASASFQLSQLFTSGGHSIGVSALASVLPMNTQDWSPLGWTGWISLQSKELSRSLLQHHISEASVLRHSAFFTVQLSHPYTTIGKTIALTRRTFVGKVMSLLFNMLSRLVITFLPKSKHLLISWLQPPSAVILEPQKINSATVSPSIVVPNSLRPHGPIRLLWPWDFPGKNTGVGCHFLLQGIFPTQGSNPGLLNCRQMFYHLSHQGS